MVSGGIPDPEKVGFLQISAIGHCENFAEPIEALCRILERQPYFVDEEGYEHKVTAASVDRERNRYAWVEYKEQEIGQYVDVHFYLNVMVDGCLIIKWEIETYNPYFGCQIGLIHWTENHLVLIYRDKHDTFICSFAAQSLDTTKPTSKRPDARYKIADAWLIWNDTVIYRSEVAERVERRSLPELRLLEPWSAAYAHSIGALLLDYHEMSEI